MKNKSSNSKIITLSAIIIIVIATCLTIATQQAKPKKVSKQLKESKTTEQPQYTHNHEHDHDTSFNDSDYAVINANDKTVNRDVSVTYSKEEYELWHDCLFNGNDKDIKDKTITKEGIFTSVDDNANKQKRYYVWGYKDKEKSCDWQWEINPSQKTTLPIEGSVVSVTGTLEASKNALDSYWINNATIELKRAYEPKYDVDMATMSSTLEMVQLSQIESTPKKYKDKTIYMYGRISSDHEVIFHPYYNNIFEVPFKAKGNIPTTENALVSITGTLDGTYNINNAVIEEIE